MGSQSTLILERVRIFAVETYIKSFLFSQVLIPSVALCIVSHGY